MNEIDYEAEIDRLERIIDAQENDISRFETDIGIISNDRDRLVSVLEDVLYSIDNIKDSIRRVM